MLKIVDKIVEECEQRTYKSDNWTDCLLSRCVNYRCIHAACVRFSSIRDNAFSIHIRKELSRAQIAHIDACVDILAIRCIAILRMRPKLHLD